MTDPSKRLSQFKSDLKQMDMNYDEQRIEDDWHREMDENHEWWERMQYVDKPESFKRRDALKETARKGLLVNDIGTPMKDMVIIAMDIPETKTKSGILLAPTTLHPDTNMGRVTALNPNSEYEFKTGDRVVFELRSVKHRLNRNGIHVIISKEGVLAVETE